MTIPHITPCQSSIPEDRLFETLDPTRRSVMFPGEDLKRGEQQKGEREQQQQQQQNKTQHNTTQHNNNNNNNKTTDNNLQVLFTLSANDRCDTGFRCWF